MDTQSKPFFSIVIPSYNRREAIVHTLETLNNQIWRDFEVIVVVDGSKDGTGERLASLQPTLSYPMRYLEQPNAGPARARNHGAEEARGQYLLFIDDDIEAVPELLAEHARIHNQNTNVVVIGITPAPSGEELSSAWAGYEAEMLNKHYRKIRDGEWTEAGPRLFYTGNSSLKRDHFWQVSGFDEKLRRGEDIELGYRLEDAGFRFILNEKARGLHLNELRSFENWQVIPYKYGRLDAQLDLQKNRYGLVAGLGQEFWVRHRLTRILVRLCLDHPLRTKILQEIMALIAKNSMGRLARTACSAIFNLNYYQGVVDELGAVEVWWANTDPSISTRYQILERQKWANTNLTPGVSILLSTRNRANALKTCLEVLLTSDYPAYEVIIADQSDDDATRQVVEPFLADKHVQYKKLASRGRSRALNEIYKLANYDLIAIMDDDCWPAQNWLYKVGEIFAHRFEIGVLIGKVSPVEHDPQTSFVPNFEFDSPRYCGLKQLKQPGGYGMGANTIARRAVWEAIGPLDEQLGPGATLPASDDLDISYRAYKAGFIHFQSPEPLIWHDGARKHAERTHLVRGYNRSATAAYTKYVRTGDWTALQLLGTTLLGSIKYTFKRLIKRQRPLGIRGLLASFEGVWQGWQQPLERETALFKSKTGQKAERDIHLPPITVGICTRNRPHDLETAARTILATSYPELELLIADQSEQDDGATERVVNHLANEYKNANVRYLKIPPIGVGYSHNQVMEYARYDVVAFTDDDCRVEPDWLFKLGKLFATKFNLGLVVGAVQASDFDPDKGFIPAFTDFKKGAASLDRYILPSRAGMGANFAMRKQAFDQVGPMDEALGSGGTLKSGSDMDYFYRFWRSGLPVHYAPDCWLWHDGFRPHPSTGQLAARSYFGIAAMFTKNLRYGDPIAAIGLLSWLTLTGLQTLRYALPRLLTGKRPLGLRNLASLFEGIIASFQTPLDQNHRVYKINQDHVDAWQDDKTATPQG